LENRDQSLKNIGIIEEQDTLNRKAQVATDNNEQHIQRTPNEEKNVEEPVLGVLDIDSAQLDSFDETDRRGLEACAKIIVHACDWNYY